MFNRLSSSSETSFDDASSSSTLPFADYALTTFQVLIQLCAFAPTILLSEDGPFPLSTVRHSILGFTTVLAQRCHSRFNLHSIELINVLIARRESYRIDGEYLFLINESRAKSLSRNSTTM